MSLLLELLVQLVVYVVLELLGEAALHGAARLLRTRTGRFAVAGTAGSVFGLAWGHHLSGGDTFPRLLWVSLGLGVAGLLVAAGRAGAPARPALPVADAWRSVLVPPWEWSAERLVGFSILNLAVAAGILITFERVVS